MVIPEKHKFLFLRIPKNASTSVASFFVNSYCNSQGDIYTGIGDAKIPPKNVSPDVLNKFRKQYRMIHLTLNEIVDNKVISEKEALGRKVIGIIRNPFDRLVSLYFFKMRNNKSNISKEDFRNKVAKGYYEDDGSNKILQTDYTRLGDKQMGNFWLYTNLIEHLQNHTKEFIPENIGEIPKYKTKFRNDKEYDDFFDKETRVKVKSYFHEDFVVYEDLLNGN